MGLEHFAIHRLEREIADVVLRGFAPRLDRADALQIGHDVADMMLRAYFIYAKLDQEEQDAAKKVLREMPQKEVVSLSKALNSLATGLESVRDVLLLSPAVRAAGVGGGTGEAR